MEENRDIDRRLEDQGYGDSDRNLENQGYRDNTFDVEGLRLVFWGLILTVINIRIMGFDIVPDIIGYIMVVIGLGQIEHYEASFADAKKAAYVLAVLSIVNIYQAPVQNTVIQGGGAMTTTNINYSAGIFGSNPILSMILMVLGTAANLYFAYCLCMGLKNLLLQVGDTGLAEICDGRWKLILVAQIGLAVIIMLAMIQLPLGLLLAIPFVVFSLIVMVLFLLLIHHSYQSIHKKGRVS